MEQQNLTTRHIVLVLVVAASFFAVSTTAQSPACTVLISLVPCLNYVSGISLSPSTGCCTKLATVVKTQPQCLCEALNPGTGSSLGISINETALPSACKVETPPVSQCSTAPAASPSGSTKSPAHGSSGSSSKSVPTLSQGSSATKLSLSVLLSLLFVAAYASSVFTSA